MPEMATVGATVSGTVPPVLATADGSYAQAATQSICTLPATEAEGFVPVLIAVSVCSTQCMAVLGTRVVDRPISTPSKMNLTRFGDHSMTVVCHWAKSTGPFA